ncbi:hypothetical protein Dimus_007359, partial [Dionaea muscipula]
MGTKKLSRGDEAARTSHRPPLDPLVARSGRSAVFGCPRLMPLLATSGCSPQVAARPEEGACHPCLAARVGTEPVLTA